LSQQISDLDRKKLRDAGINAGIESGGKVYFSPGGGIMSNKKPLVVVENTDRLMRLLTDIQRDFGTTGKRDEIAKEVGTSINDLDFHLIESGDGKWDVVESKSQVSLGQISLPFSE
jgi:hypothetical protein